MESAADWLWQLTSASPPTAMWVVVGLGLITSFIQIILALAKAIGYATSRRDRRQDRDSDFENAWFSVLVVERALPELLKFLDTGVQSILGTSSLAQHNNKSKNEEFLLGVEQLKRKLVSVTALSKDAHTRLLEALDSLADEVTRYLAAQDGFGKAASDDEMRIMFNACESQCVGHLREMHRRLAGQ